MLLFGCFIIEIENILGEIHYIFRPLVYVISFLLGGLDAIEREYAEISLSLKFSLGKIVCVCSLVRH